jgi:hypothetical protein
MRPPGLLPDLELLGRPRWKTRHPDGYDQGRIPSDVVTLRPPRPACDRQRGDTECQRVAIVPPERTAQRSGDGERQRGVCQIGCRQQAASQALRPGSAAPSPALAPRKSIRPSRLG